MNVYLHDGRPDIPLAPGAPDEGQGPTHCGTIRVDYEYQVEEWVADIERDHGYVVRIVTDSGREWRRDIDGRFVEQVAHA